MVRHDTSPRVSYLTNGHMCGKNIAIILVPDSSFPFPHLWTGTRFLSGGLTDGKDAIDVLEQPGDRCQDLPRPLPRL